jgi:hypothetical protein
MKLSYLILVLISLSAAYALPAVEVEQGEAIIVQVDTHARRGATIAADFSIKELGYNHRITRTHTGSSIIEDELRINAEPGTYILDVQLYVNHAFVRKETMAVTVLGEGDERTTTPPRVRAPAPQGTITIAPVPDVTPGTTLVLPVKITGNGTYELVLPKLDFATYEVPAPVTVRNEATTSILLHIREDAQPGTYTIPVSAGGEETSVRVRVIKYAGEKDYSLLIVLGVFLILIGVLAIILLRRRHDDERAPPRTDNDKSELITYY